MDIYNFLYEHFSYTILFIWSIFEGEIGLTIAGMLSNKGSLTFQYVLGIAVIGALIGDITLFAIGYFSKHNAEKILQQYEKKVQSIERWFQHYGSWIIIFERFIYGTHIPALLVLGSSGYSFIKFLLLDILGVVLWAMTFTTLGFYFGQNAIDVLVFIQHHLSVVIFLFFFFFIIYQYKKD
ncbi:DedA family protein [Sulfurimonas paralvinellae]|uniref:DedA family protein n=1 Tax=Sulfurimonas paralvinellae TaxID=317658 RepID=A0A7M1B6Z9_9BACT|nr:DedA family protein [Sulfurimonas paralvinellae]QOP45450.1 DedA family protein [Sulfurimonas paralvinellae]